MHSSEEKDKTPVDNPNRRIEQALLCQRNDAMESWRIFKIMSEFVSGFELLRRYGKAVTFFGTARCSIGDRVYQQTLELSGRLSREGFAVITGGGGGAMEAANRGAFEAGGNSIGLNIQLPREQILNKYVTDSQAFHYFFTRKVMLAFAAEVYIFMPGGFGTLDEFFEMATLVQTKKVQPLPLVLFGRDFWEPLTLWIEKTVFEGYRAIDREDLGVYHIVDSVDEAFDTVVKLSAEFEKYRAEICTVPELKG
jgi:uncharacterized protein (TIGR00730 family)